MKSRLKKYRKYLFLSVGLSILAQAAIYQKTEQNGKVYFSDVPTANATVVKLQAVNIYAPVNQAGAAVKNPTAVAENPYKKFAIAQPMDQQTFQNQQEISAALEIKPDLRSGDKTQWWLDGNSYQQSTSTQLTLSGLARGEHKLQVKLLAADNQILATTPAVTFYVHYATTTQKP